MPGLLDQVDPYAGGYSLMEDPFEAAARRQRQAVMPIGGRPLLGVGGASAVGAMQMNTGDVPGLLQ
jgi:hypothetical protein